MCKQCASLNSNTLVADPHAALCRRVVRVRMENLSETYECVDCGTGWERIVTPEDAQTSSYRWRMKAPALWTYAPVDPAIQCADLERALACWTRAPLSEQAHL